MNKTRLKLPAFIHQHKVIVQFIEYMIGGGLFFWSGYGTFAFSFSILKINWLLAKFLGDVVGLTVNYFVQRYWAFNSPMLDKETGRVSGRYLVISAINLVMDYVIVVGLHQLFGVSVYVGAFVSATFFTVWNWLWYKFWVFNPRRSGKA